jgi:hypothetical protein
MIPRPTYEQHQQWASQETSKQQYEHLARKYSKASGMSLQEVRGVIEHSVRRFVFPLRFSELRMMHRYAQRERRTDVAAYMHEVIEAAKRAPKGEGE